MKISTSSKFWLSSCLFCFLFLFWITSCKTHPEETTDNTIPEEADSAIRTLLDSIAIAPSAEVFVVGPVQSGSVLRERNEDTTVRVELAVPNLLNGCYVFFIDDEPDLKFSHFVRYAWVQPSTGRVSVINAQWEPLLIQPNITPVPFSQMASADYDSTLFHYGTGGGVGRFPTGSKPVARGPESAENFIPDTPCQKIAVVFDAGETPAWYERSGEDDMAESAGLVGDFLTNNGFAVRRISQYEGNDIPGVHPRNGNDDNMSTALGEIITSYASLMTCPCDDDCHEFFLYIAAHGEKKYFEVHQPYGSGVTGVTYRDVNQWLSRFQPCVKVIVFIDACKSGGALPVLQGQCNLRSNCGFTFLCTADSLNGSSVGDGLEDSGTEDWAEGTGDADADGKDGDLGDRWLNLADENSSRNPQSYICPGQSDMCSTD